jgi:hypothetical protein
MNTRRKTNQSDNRTEDAQDINALKQRYDDLREKKTIAETDLRNAERELQKLKKEAKEAYGTDDLTSLQKKLEAMRQANEDKRAAYQKALEKIENDLQAVEEKYDESKQEEAE